MKKVNGEYVAELPAQPPAGKLEYYVILKSGKETIKLPSGDENVIIRFKGKVPIFVLIIHILVMFSAMLLSVRTGLEAFKKEPKFVNLTYWTIALLFLGGFIMGPIVQYYAFGAFWTGFPFGTDLTDNKTLIALVGWLVALYFIKRSPKT